MRGHLPAALLAVLGLSCGSSSGEEVATDAVAFQPFSAREGPSILAINKRADALVYRVSVPPAVVSGLKLRNLFLPGVETSDGALLLLDLAESAPKTIAVSSSIVRCFQGYVCQTAAGDVVEPVPSAMTGLTDFPAVRGATTCDGLYCLVGGRAVALDGRRPDISGTLADVVGVSWVEFGSPLGGRNGYAFLRADGSVATTGWDFEKTYVTEVAGLPPIRKIHRGGIYEDYSGHMWYFGVAPEGWSDNLIPAEVPRRQCQVKPGKKLSPLDVPCVVPTMLPALDGTLPQVIYNEAFLPVFYAIGKDGTLRCWSAPGGPACVKGE
jgi:hypothetical protein